MTVLLQRLEQQDRQYDRLQKRLDGLAERPAAQQRQAPALENEAPFVELAHTVQEQSKAFKRLEQCLIKHIGQEQVSVQPSDWWGWWHSMPPHETLDSLSEIDFVNLRCQAQQWLTLLQEYSDRKVLAKYKMQT
jgi:hypothetical protein